MIRCKILFSPLRRMPKLQLTAYKLNAQLLLVNLKITKRNKISDYFLVQIIGIGNIIQRLNGNAI